MEMMPLDWTNTLQMIQVYQSGKGRTTNSRGNWKKEKEKWKDKKWRANLKGHGRQSGELIGNGEMIDISRKDMWEQQVEQLIITG